MLRSISKLMNFTQNVTGIICIYLMVIQPNHPCLQLSSKKMSICIKIISHSSFYSYLIIREDYNKFFSIFSGHLLTKSNVTFGNVPQQIIARSGKAFIYFYSDENEVRSGFNISYRCINLVLFLVIQTMLLFSLHLVCFRFIDNCSCINGKCNIAGLCTCHDGWSGHYCNIPLNCSCVNGVCNDTDCHCVDGFTGV